MAVAYIALGSNLQQPARQLTLALDALDRLPDTTLAAVSGIYRSAAVGPGTQPDYLNAVARLQTGLAPLALLHALQEIEQAQGRERGIRWGPRTLDLDILLYDQLQLRSDELRLPHPAMRERPFVLYPLAELDPALVLPCGTALGTLLAACPAVGLTALGPLNELTGCRMEG
jgi:2-amino-4-hydroxy-6-hydroxymethyldihydropteridine diphosphokinase